MTVNLAPISDASGLDVELEGSRYHSCKPLLCKLERHEEFIDEDELGLPLFTYLMYKNLNKINVSVQAV